ncbi:hypothetical protein ACFRAO_17240 [Streptomyces sp. NPDC056656]|uniref:hypothetical protein n=1 Tax=Streptomyces sp. NPDC056656 TaxID=3345895 RepID=UPI00368724BD
MPKPEVPVDPAALHRRLQKAFHHPPVGVLTLSGQSMPLVGTPTHCSAVPW